MLIDTSAKISPLMIIGMAVRITSSGGGIRNGLNMKVDSNCQIKKASTSDAADRRMPRYLPGLIDARSLLNEARRKSGAWGSFGLVSRTFTIGQRSLSRTRSRRRHCLL